MRRLIVSVAVLLAVAGCAFAVTRLVAGGGSSPPLAGGGPPAIEAGRDPLDVAVEQIEEDRKKPRFEGDLGPFIAVSPRSEATIYEPPLPCPEPLSEKQLGPEDGDMYFVLPDGTTPGGTVCADGTVLNAMASYPGTEPDSILIMKWRFGGDKPYFRVEAPRERLELTTIAGRPAVIVHPAQSVFPDYRLALMEKPGMMLELSGLTDLPGMLRLAEHILAQGGE
jgi:hypothetical protein